VEGRTGWWLHIVEQSSGFSVSFPRVRVCILGRVSTVFGSLGVHIAILGVEVPIARPFERAGVWGVLLLLVWAVDDLERAGVVILSRLRVSVRIWRGSEMAGKAARTSTRLSIPAMSRRQTATTSTATRPPRSERDANPYANLDIFSFLIQAQPQLDIGSNALTARCDVFKTGVEKFVTANREEIVKRREVYTNTVAREREAAKELQREIEGCQQQQIQLIKRTPSAFLHVS
jgi:hypothetical protein